MTSEGMMTVLKEADLRSNRDHGFRSFLLYFFSGLDLKKLVLMEESGLIL